MKTQVEDLAKQVVDVQYDATQNKQFLEDQLAELGQSTEGLQDKILTTAEKFNQDVEQVKADIQKLESSSERQF